MVCFMQIFVTIRNQSEELVQLLCQVEIGKLPKDMENGFKIRFLWISQITGSMSYTF